MSLINKGYADGNYSCTCHACNKPFNGDKRAVTCATCAHEAELQEKLVELLREIEADYESEYMGQNQGKLYRQIIQDKINKLAN